MFIEIITSCSRLISMYTHNYVVDKTIPPNNNSPDIFIFLDPKTKEHIHHINDEIITKYNLDYSEFYQLYINKCLSSGNIIALPSTYRKIKFIESLVEPG